MKSLLAVLLIAIPAVAHAGPPPGDADHAERARRMRTRLTIELADALRLDNAAALKLSAALEASMQQQEPLHQKVRESMQVIRAAANADPAALAKLDESVKALHEARLKLVENESDSFTAITKDFTPVQRAKFLVTVVRIFRMGGGPRGHGEGHGPGEGRGEGRGERRHLIDHGGLRDPRGGPTEAPKEN